MVSNFSIYSVQFKIISVFSVVENATNDHYSKFQVAYLRRIPPFAHIQELLTNNETDTWAVAAVWHRYHTIFRADSCENLYPQNCHRINYPVPKDS